jgi:hypothetical protein
MIKTAVKWNDIHTEEQTAMFLAKSTEIYSRYPGVVQPDWIVEQLGITMSSPYLRIIYRFWPDVAAAQEWIDFLNSANLVHLESAIIVTE